MIRFAFLESAGLSIAAMSDQSDGDCRLPAEGNGFAGREDRASFISALGVEPARLLCVRQVHGADILVADGSHAGQGAFDAQSAPGDYDAIIVAEPGLPIAVSVADCVPLVMYDPARGVAAVGHAGRVGTMKNVAGAIVRRMVAEFDSRPADIVVEIGPSAGPESYEVSTDIAEEFAALGLPRSGRLLDLWGANRVQLEEAGVPSRNIRVTGICTIGSGRFHSHRRDGSGARNIAVAVL